jgi:predicted small secreted protein
MKKIILLIGILLTINSCSEKNETELTPLEQLPKATQTGENTFGCLINGEAFVVYNTSLQTAIYQGGILQIGGAINDSNRDINIILNISNPINLNTPYDLTFSPKNIAIFVNNKVNCYYDYSNTLNGSFTINNFDTMNYIISGTFEFSTNKTGCEDIEITDGRFDLKYIP